MSSEERRLMRRVDEIVLGASPERLKELQRLDVETQMSGTTFYDHVIESGALVAPRSRRRA